LAPSTLDQGLRDTVGVQEPSELLVKFSQPAATAPFMYHCHILEHEDHGMMASSLSVDAFHLVDSGTDRILAYFGEGDRSFRLNVTTAQRAVVRG